MSEWLAGFHTWLRGEYRSPYTHKGYGRTIERAVRHWEKQLGRPVQPADLEPPLLRAFLDAHAHQQPNTRNRRVSALKSLGRYLLDTGQKDSDPANKLRRPEIPETLPRFLDQPDAGRLVDAPASGLGGPRILPQIRARDGAALEVYYTGMLRVCEMQRLKVTSVTFGETDQGRPLAHFLVHGKGDKWRRFACEGTVVSALQAYLAERPKFRPRTDALFVSLRGGPLCLAALHDLVKRWGRRVGLEVHPHMMRHSGATHLLEEGANIVAIKDRLGHKNLRTTQIYTHCTSRLRDECAARHPRARKARPAPLPPPGPPPAPSARTMLRRAVCLIRDLGRAVRNEAHTWLREGTG